MQFLADENVEWPIVMKLRRLGYDIKAIKEISAGTDDEAVLQLAFKEKRILLTNDMDFGRLVLHQKKNSAGVVLMRFSNESSAQKIKAIEHLLKFHSEKLAKHFTVISEEQIKIRPIT